MLQRFNKPYMFYLEKKDDRYGPYLKYGKKGKGVKHFLDLSQLTTQSSGDVTIAKVADSQRKFRIESKEIQLVIKCETYQEREDWIETILHSAGLQYQNHDPSVQDDL